MALFESCVISARSKALEAQRTGWVLFESCVISARSKAQGTKCVVVIMFESCVISARSKADTWQKHITVFSLRAV